MIVTGSLILGQEQDEPGGGFIGSEVMRGDISQVNIWSSVLSDEYIKEISMCLSENHGDVFSSDVNLPSINKAIIKDMPLESLCTIDSHLVALPTSKNFYLSARDCATLGSSIFAPNDTKRNTELQKTAADFALKCPGTFWIGIVMLSGFHQDNYFQVIL